MRRAAKVDDNQKETVSAFRKFGCSVLHLHSIGQGCPDLMVAVGGRTFAVEIKDGTQPPSKQRLTPAEQSWKDSWRGQYVVLNSVEGAVQFVAWANLEHPLPWKA